MDMLFGKLNQEYLPSDYQAGEGIDITGNTISLKKTSFVGLTSTDYTIKAVNNEIISGPTTLELNHDYYVIEFIPVTESAEGVLLQITESTSGNNVFVFDDVFTPNIINGVANEYTVVGNNIYGNFNTCTNCINFDYITEGSQEYEIEVIMRVWN